MRNQLPIFKWFESDKECEMYYSQQSDTDLTRTTLTNIDMMTDTVSGGNNSCYNLNRRRGGRYHVNELISDDEMDIDSIKHRGSTNAGETPRSLSMDLP